MPMEWMHAVGKCLPTTSDGWDATGSTGSDAQKRLRFNSQALASDQGPSTSTPLTLHCSSKLWPGQAAQSKHWEKSHHTRTVAIFMHLWSQRFLCFYFLSPINNISMQHLGGKLVLIEMQQERGATEKSTFIVVCHHYSGAASHTRYCCAVEQTRP